MRGKHVGLRRMLVPGKHDFPGFAHCGAVAKGRRAMNNEENGRKNIRKIRTLIYGRTLIVFLAFVIQFIWVYVGYLWLREYSYIVYGLLATISAAVLIHLFNTKGTPDLKLVWMLPIAVFPVFGALFYLYITMQPGTQMLQKRLEILSAATAKHIFQAPQVKENLAAEDVHMGRFADYMLTYDNSPVYGNTQVTYYALGDDQFSDILEELKKAEKFIFLEFFIVEEGYMWNSVLEILKERVKAGVEVRLLYDGMCSLYLLPSFYPRMMEQEGIKCQMFSPIKPIFSTKYNNRDHRKIIVVDGKVAFTGGTNLADEYINRKVRFGHWKDTAVRLRGDAVERFTYMFLELWNVSERREEEYSKYKSPVAIEEINDGYIIPYSASPYGEERVGKRVYLDILNTAEYYVHIMTPYLILDYEVMKALTYAAKRGVDVQIIMPYVPDKRYAFILAKTYYNELLDAGVKIYEYIPGFVHAKVFVADDEKAVVGSLNLDYRSLYHHFECAAFLYRNSEIEAIKKDFDRTLEKCKVVTTEDYKKQKWWVRLAGKCLRMFAPLM